MEREIRMSFDDGEEKAGKKRIWNIAPEGPFSSL